jgi:hypothetical protein
MQVLSETEEEAEQQESGQNLVTGASGRQGQRERIHGAGPPASQSFNGSHQYDLELEYCKRRYLPE